MRWARGVLGIATLVGVFALLTPPSAGANSLGPPDQRTGAFAEMTCNSLLCHNSFELNSGTGMVAIDGPSSYEPGQTYPILVDVAHPDQMRWGFELTVLDEITLMAGELAPLDANTQVSTTLSRQYIKHTLSGTAPGRADGNTWTFEWTAPDTDVGEVRLYVAGNAANGNGSQFGDYIYTTTLPVPVPEPTATSMALAALAALGALRWRAVAERKG